MFYKRISRWNDRCETASLYTRITLHEIAAYPKLNRTRFVYAKHVRQLDVTVSAHVTGEFHHRDVLEKRETYVRNARVLSNRKRRRARP